MQLAFETVGTSDKPALMLIHGFISSNTQWLTNRDALSEHYQLIMVELWGHGRSPTPTEPTEFSADAYVTQFERIRETLGIELTPLDDALAQAFAEESP